VSERPAAAPDPLEPLAPPTVTAGDRGAGRVVIPIAPSQISDHGEADATGQSAPHKSLPVLPLCPEKPPEPAQPLAVQLAKLDLLVTDAADSSSWLPDRRTLASCLVSFVVHAALMVILAMIIEAHPPGTPGISLASALEGPEGLETLWEEGDPEISQSTPEPMTGQLDAAERPAEAIDVAVPDEGATAAESAPRESQAIGFQSAEATDWLMGQQAIVGGGLEGRSLEARSGSLARHGGTPDSEMAVQRGLRWLAAHQGRDGGWQFNLKNCGCNGYCRNPGTVPTTTGATALSLLAFLGNNQTHLEGEHRDVVRNGLYYLAKKAMLSADGADLREGTMYAQGLAALALAEAYAMTDDPGLKDLAQQSINYVVYAQDRKGGGWRYSPGEPGDTTVGGWQMMALKSGDLARLHAPRSAFYLFQRFLDGVESDQGSLYGYMDREMRRTTTAVGLLCRMYGGWRHETPALARGVAHLADWGPSENDIYYDYYATQVLFHWGGSDWERWNRKLRDHLIRTQGAQGHESGSWHFTGAKGEVAGRLYTTAMAVMTLEVYYRYMPLYGEKTFDK
jgi:hypothetical protein